MRDAILTKVLKCALLTVGLLGADPCRADLNQHRARALVAEAVESRIERLIDEQYPELANFDERTLRQVVFSRLLATPQLLDLMGLSDAQVRVWKESREPLPEQVWVDLFGRAEIIRKIELEKVLTQLKLPLAPPPSKGTIFTIEIIKGWIALSISSFGVAMMGLGFVPHDSQVGQVLAPVSILAAIYLLLRGVAIPKRFAEQERQLIKWDEAVNKAASDNLFQGESKGLFALALIKRQARRSPGLSDCAQSFGVFRTPSG